ncbi:hypothetical protein SEA_PUPPER_160 [Gordonia phage Pupper]|uniref:Uncharacterized protein n=1 Tax=Gordonia phage Pupper TaxID=2571249 RepID=A0A4Y6EIT8_9CAUD|nr:hypothetical protein KHQ83_gp117 [Gordonia phage Pupper]QDF18646.1 hypothetical protein SEA_PUPPER_160 [Gordonia phage Pupper]QDF18878.1 hypothetical protein SEA_SCENTAE_159 [Gordonia phage SCentae]
MTLDGDRDDAAEGGEEEMVPVSRLGSVRSGVDYDLEALADEFLRGSRQGLTRLADKQDYLTAEQLDLRRGREVYNSNGVPDIHIVSGLYRRAYNPLAGKRPNRNTYED